MGRYRLFTMEVEVHDLDQLYKRALRHLTQVDGLTEDEAQEILQPYGEPDVGACLIAVLDPGSLDGCDIQGSSVE